MAYRSNRPSLKGFQTLSPTTPSTPTLFDKIKFALAYIGALALMVFGCWILIAMSAPTIVEPHFEHQAQMIFGFGMLCMMCGARLAIWLAIDGEKTPNTKTLVALCNILIALCALMIAYAAWGYYML